jgi:hypothetical protein
MRNIPLQKLMQDLYESGDYFASIPPDVGAGYEEEYMTKVFHRHFMDQI